MRRKRATSCTFTASNRPIISNVKLKQQVQVNADKAQTTFNGTPQKPNDRLIYRSKFGEVLKANVDEEHRSKIAQQATPIVRCLNVLF
ncbi:hypothetical protein H6F78_24865 [Coleofasciculus sp. FACHB-64]|uniref:hypothetical protein n=1 Tax=Cyanophyceae TaxID=3028117 RepID=UPI001683F0A7|nr:MULTISPECIES: hypothetical protein [unclassified Coleofasciculus]MBD1838728.1 hypothetical protein [Coleofasciculus sp. FACHB-501]MBD2048790.1 hypothetical protein [Coleofasciculus sp. FACHB-64]